MSTHLINALTIFTQTYLISCSIRIDNHVGLTFDSPTYSWQDKEHNFFFFFFFFGLSSSLSPPLLFLFWGLPLLTSRNMLTQSPPTLIFLHYFILRDLLSITDPTSPYTLSAHMEGVIHTISSKSPTNTLTLWFTSSNIPMHLGFV